LKIHPQLFDINEIIFQMNMARAELLGWGVQVAYPNLTEVSLSWALNEVLDNPKYKTNTLKIANLLKDQPQTPMERAIFWIEYVLRNDGAHYMQSSAQYLNFGEYYNLDVYAMFAAIIILIIIVPIYVVKKILGCFKGRKLKTN
jgi:glucuronosyltransferase